MVEFLSLYAPAQNVSNSGMSRMEILRRGTMQRSTDRVRSLYREWLAKKQ